MIIAVENYFHCDSLISLFVRDFRNFKCTGRCTDIEEQTPPGRRGNSYLSYSTTTASHVA